MKKIFKVLSLVLVFMLAIAPLAVSFAEDPTGFAKPTIVASSEFINKTGVGNWFGAAIGALKFIGYGVAVVMILWLGIQYMLAQPAKKAELKGKMWSMLIGIILLVAGVTIIDIIWNAAENLDQQQNTDSYSATQNPE